MSPVLTLWQHGASPAHEARHVLLARMRVLRWLLILLGLPVFALLLLTPQLGPNHHAAPTVWLLVSGIGMVCYGMNLAQAVCVALRETDVLRPRARVLWRQACAHVGSSAIVLVALGAFALALKAGIELTPQRALAWLALPSLALASGFAVLCAGLMRRRRALFIAVLAFALSLWLAYRAGVALHQPPLALGLWWLAAWPAALLALRAALPVNARTTQPVRLADALRSDVTNVFIDRRHARFEASRADPRWLLPPHRPWGSTELWSWALLLGLLAWVSKDWRSVFDTLIYIAIAGSAFVGMTNVMTGLRPRLLLLPGARYRHSLSWYVFRHALREAASVLPLVALSIAIGAFLQPWPWALRATTVALLLIAVVVLALALQVALRALVPRTAWRMMTQFAASLLFIVAGVLGAAWWIGADDVPLTTQRVALALGGAAALVLASVLVVRLSVKAWSRLDLALVTREERWQGPFDAPEVRAQQRQP